MKPLHKARKGFSLIEMIIVAIILAIITMSVFLISDTVSAMRIRARNNILLTNHNLNVMEQLRQEMYRIGEYEQLEVYYGFDDDADEWDAIFVATSDLDAANNLNNYRPNFSTYTYALRPGTTLVETHPKGDGSGAYTTLKDEFPRSNTGDIRTDVYLQPSMWDNFHVYTVRIESTVMGYAQKLTNTYVLTDIGIELNPITSP